MPPVPPALLLGNSALGQRPLLAGRLGPVGALAWHRSGRPLAHGSGVPEQSSPLAMVTGAWGRASAGAPDCEAGPAALQ